MQTRSTCLTKKLRASHLVQLLWSRWLPLSLIHFITLTGTGSCDAPASVHLYSSTAWPHASTPHFRHRQILHIFDLQYSIIGHQLNYYGGVIILNLSVQNCRNKEEWLIILTFACRSTTMQFFCCSLGTYQSFFSFFKKKKCVYCIHYVCKCRRGKSLERAQQFTVSQTFTHYNSHTGTCDKGSFFIATIQLTSYYYPNEMNWYLISLTQYQVILEPKK